MKYPSVSKILYQFTENFLVDWMKRVGIQKAEEIKVQAMEVGKEVESYIGKIERKEALYTPKSLEVQSGIKAFTAWKRDKGVKLHQTPEQILERPLKSDKYGYAGRLDALGLVEEKESLIDFKVSGQISSVYELQVAAYYFAYKEQHPDSNIEQAMIVRFDKKMPVYQMKVVENLEETFEIFLSYLKIYNWRNRK